jgi:dTDP-3,4-didehydro-2,6-dideoxy-alpha-D-glucose 3-reductase
MEILVLGCSNVFLRRVLPALNSNKEIKKIHIASKSKTQAIKELEFCNKIGIWFDDYSVAINSLCSDLVYISLPNHLHFKWAKKSLETGLNVIVEKPATINFLDSENLVELSLKKNLCLAESIVWPFHPIIDIVKNNLNLAQNKLIVVNASFTVPSFKSDNFRNFSEYGGGAFNDMSAYAASIGRVLFNKEPTSISGKQLAFDESTHINTCFSIKLEFGKNKIVKGVFGFGLDYQNNIEINGSNFLFELNRVFSPPADIEIPLKTRKNSLFTEKFYKGDAYAQFFESMLATYKTKEKIEWSNNLLKDATISNKLKPLIIS